MPRAVAQLVRVAVSLCVVFVAAPHLEASTPCAPRSVTHARISTVDHYPAKDAVTIASLNIAGHPRVADAVVAWTHAREVDILFLQEVGDASTDGGAFAAALIERLCFYFAYASANRVGDVQTQGLAIVSRYPLDDVRVHPLPYYHLRFKSRCRIALAATVTTADGQLPSSQRPP
jgi:hypothetical protein